MERAGTGLGTGRADRCIHYFPEGLFLQQEGVEGDKVLGWIDSGKERLWRNIQPVHVEGSALPGNGLRPDEVVMLIDEYAASIGW